jgi:eukaryotic-like serine/threonine-protein kinase
MSLADQIRRLETLLQRGELDTSQFEERVAELIRSASASSDTTRPDISPAAVRLSGMLGGPTPTHIGAYELVELLGQGGMGAVYLAKHILKPGLFAVKVPRHELLSQPGFGHRFKREASVGLRLDHPGIVRVHDLIIDGDWAAIVMDFVAGPNLETLLRNQGGPFPRDRVLDLMVQVFDAMEYAHAEGVVHRDLKPKNLIVRPNGRVQVTDFGIATLVGLDEAQASGPVGTAAYMAPELYTGGSVDQRADIYALGMTLYKLLAGHLPFQEGMTSYQVLRAKETGHVPLPAHFAADMPTPVVEVVARAIHPDPERRFGGCSEFKAGLLAACGEEDWVPAVIVPPPLSADLPRPKAEGGRLQYAILAVLVALLLAVVWVGLSLKDTEPLDPGPAKTSTDLAPYDGIPAIARVDEDITVEPETPTPTPELPPKVRPDRTPRATAPPRGTRTPRPMDPVMPTVSRPTPSPTPEPTPPRVAVATPEPTPPVVVPDVGLLYLSSRPASQVEIDGRSYGTTEDTRKGLVLPPGTYKVRFICTDPVCDGFERRSGLKTLKVVAGQDTRYLADFFSLNP